MRYKANHESSRSTDGSFMRSLGKNYLTFEGESCDFALERLSQVTLPPGIGQKWHRDISNLGNYAIGLSAQSQARPCGP